MPKKRTTFFILRHKKAFQHLIIQKDNDTYSAYGPFSRLSSKKLINSSEILEINIIKYKYIKRRWLFCAQMLKTSQT